MVIPRRWKVVSGGVTMAVALGAGAAVAKTGGDDLPKLEDVQQSQLQVGASLLQTGDTPVLTLQDESPLSGISAQSLESEPSTVSEESDPSTVSQESDPTVSVASASLESDPSVSVQTVSPESLDSDD